MEDLENRKMFKIMWVPGEKSPLWNMRDESNIGMDSSIFKLFASHFDLTKWSNDYEIVYKKWLDEQSDELHDLTVEVNQRIMKFIKKINEESESNPLFFYWFDKDRTFENENFLWTNSPLSGENLFNLGGEYHFLNRLVSMRDYLVFPEYPKDK